MSEPGRGRWETKNEFFTEREALKYGMSTHDLLGMTFKHMGHTKHAGPQQFLLAPSPCGHPSFCWGSSMSPKHRFSWWKVIYGAFSCERKIDPIISKFICKSAVSNSSHFGIRYIFLPSSVCIFKIVKIFLNDNLLSACTYAKGRFRETLKESVLKGKESSITYKFNSPMSLQPGHMSQILSSHSVFLCPNHYNFSYFLKKEFKYGQSSEELSCFQALLLECF